ncbi:acetyl-CoA acetyltransferase [Leptolyngbya sp. NIES-3755]|nr:acetyl-CoA acetyltransferase [Leptolyngbya sp. NIES-3755]
MQEAYIVSSVRTAIAKAPRGKLRNLRSDDLGAIALKAALERVPDLDLNQIEDVIFGCAFPEAEQGMNLGRVIAQRAGLPNSVAGATVNRFCASGLQAIAQAHQAIVTGQADVMIAGGAESMSLIPMGGHDLLPNPTLVAEMPQFYCTMGATAERVAQQYDISRADQDAFALRSHQRAIEAMRSGRFDDELISVPVHETIYLDGKLQVIESMVQTDEGPRPDTSLEALSKLPAVFRVGGSVTAGNSSQTSDGAAATILVNEAKLKEFKLQPLGRLLGFAVAGVPPEIMGIGPVVAVPKVLQQVGLRLEDIGLIELNEAFAAQSLAVIRKLGLNKEIVNVNGGAIALGHPLGCTGARVTATLLHEMKRRGVQYGLATMCVGGGMGAAAVFENLMR